MKKKIIAGVQRKIQEKNPEIVYRYLKRWPALSKTGFCEPDNPALEITFEEGTLNCTLLHWASKIGHVSLTRQILKHYPEAVDMLNREGHTPLCLAAMRGHEVIVSFLLEKGAQDQINIALHIACSYGITGVVRQLLERGADPNAVIDSETLLHLATRLNLCDIVILLLKHGAEINAVSDIWEWTALHRAVSQAYFDIAKVLMMRGARILLDKDGYTPFDLEHHCEGQVGKKAEALYNDIQLNQPVPPPFIPAFERTKTFVEGLPSSSLLVKKPDQYSPFRERSL